MIKIEKRKQYPLKMPIKLDKFLRDTSKQKGMSINSLIVQALWQMKEIEEQKNR